MVDINMDLIKLNKLNKGKLHSAFIGNIWGADLADMQLISNLITDLDFHCVLLIYMEVLFMCYSFET